MNRVVVFIGSLLMAGLCFAGSDYDIKLKEIDANGNIVIWTKYKLDGTVVDSNYPQSATPPRMACPAAYWNTTRNACTVWASRYSIENFAGMDSAAIKTRIKKDCKAFARHLIKKKFDEISNTNLDLSATIGTTDSFTTEDVYLDTDADGVLDTVWHVSSDGTKTEEPYTP